MQSPIFSDLSLSRRLERAEGRASASFVDTRARLYPDSGAESIEVAGALAMFDGPASPITQTFGLGMFEPVTAVNLGRLEEFFRAHGAPIFHEVSPLADPSALALLNERGYQPVELTTILFRPIDRDVRLAATRNERIRVWVAGEDEQDLWSATAAHGWSEFAEVAGQVAELGRVSFNIPGAVCFLAELEGEAIATGTLLTSDGVALLAGASTVPEARKQGAQLALLEARLRHGAGAGCDFAMMGAAPGSASQRNAERHGFRIAYTRIKWRLGQ